MWKLTVYYGQTHSELHLLKQNEQLLLMNEERLTWVEWKGKNSYDNAT